MDCLTKKFQDETIALSSIDLSIDKGELVILLGHNRSGKSTLLRMIGGIEPLTFGEILLDGRSISQANQKEMRRLRQKMGFVFRKFNLVPTLTVFQNVMFGALGRHPFIITTLHPFAKKKLREKSDELFRACRSR